MDNLFLYLEGIIFLFSVLKGNTISKSLQNQHSLQNVILSKYHATWLKMVIKVFWDINFQGFKIYKMLNLVWWSPVFKKISLQNDKPRRDSTRSDMFTIAESRLFNILKNTMWLSHLTFLRTYLFCTAYTLAIIISRLRSQIYLMFLSTCNSNIYNSFTAVCMRTT